MEIKIQNNFYDLKIPNTIFYKTLYNISITLSPSNSGYFSCKFIHHANCMHAFATTNDARAPGQKARWVPNGKPKVDNLRPSRVCPVQYRRGMISRTRGTAN